MEYKCLFFFGYLCKVCYAFRITQLQILKVDDIEIENCPLIKQMYKSFGTSFPKQRSSSTTCSVTVVQEDQIKSQQNLTATCMSRRLQIKSKRGKRSPYLHSQLGHKTGCSTKGLDASQENLLPQGRFTIALLVPPTVSPYLKRLFVFHHTIFYGRRFYFKSLTTTFHLPLTFSPLKLTLGWLK